MKHLALLVISFMFLTLGTALARDVDVSKAAMAESGGIDFTYSTPEIFFTEPEVLKLSVVWEILNCFKWEDGKPINQCYNLEFYVVNPTSIGDIAFTSILEGTECLNGPCDAITTIPLVSLLTPEEYARYQMGIFVMKDIRLHLAFGGEEDEFGRIVHRHLAEAFYNVKIIFNGTGFGSVSIMSMERESSL